LTRVGGENPDGRFPISAFLGATKLGEGGSGATKLGEGGCFQNFYFPPSVRIGQAHVGSQVSIGQYWSGRVTQKSTPILTNTD
jgi:hypothetical protein